MARDESGGYCERCDENVVIWRPSINHILHLLITFCTCGWWIIIWFLVSLRVGGWRCSRCGVSTGDSPIFQIVMICGIAAATFGTFWSATYVINGYKPAKPQPAAKPVPAPNPDPAKQQPVEAAPQEIVEDDPALLAKQREQLEAQRIAKEAADAQATIERKPAIEERARLRAIELERIKAETDANELAENIKQANGRISLTKQLLQNKKADLPQKRWMLEIIELLPGTEQAKEAAELLKQIN